MEINWQAIGGFLESQRRLSFTLPRGCLLDELIVVGPEDEAEYPSDSEDGDENGPPCPMVTNVDISVLNQCKVS